MIVGRDSSPEELRGSVDVGAGKTWSVGMDEDGRHTEVMSRVRLREASDGALLRALRAAARGDASDGEIQTAIESVCAAAREQGIAVEQVLIILKERWRELPEAERLLRRAAEETRARLITICIDAYYAPYHRK